VVVLLALILNLYVSIPLELKEKIGVTIDGSELVLEQLDDHNKQEQRTYQENVLKKLFAPNNESPVSLVQIACHEHEFEACLHPSIWLKK